MFSIEIFKTDYFHVNLKKNKKCIVVKNIYFCKRIRFHRKNISNGSHEIAVERELDCLKFSRRTITPSGFMVVYFFLKNRLFSS